MKSCTLEQILRSPDVLAVDPPRVVIDTRCGGISGHEARQILFNDHHVQVEMATDTTIVAPIGAGSAPNVDGLMRGLNVLPDLGAGRSEPIRLPRPGPAAMSLREAYFAASELVPAERTVGGESLPTRWPPTRPVSRTCYRVK